MINDYPSLKLVRSKNYISLEGNETDKRKVIQTVIDGRDTREFYEFKFNCRINGIVLIY